jgi:hypothetical protein
MKKSNKKEIKPVFLGYVIASDKEDFLLDYVHNDGFQFARWHSFPDAAKLFLTLEEAFAVFDLMKSDYSVFLMEIYDAGKQVFLLPVESFPIPDWVQRIALD